MRAVVLAPLYLLVVLSPLVLAWALGAPPRRPWEDLGSALGMLAFSLILVECVLSGRFKSVSRRIGMDVTMRVHQLMARSALVFALLHPLFYRGAPSGGPRPWDTTRALSVTTDFPSLASGVLAYVLLPSLVVLALRRNAAGQSYETWRLLHGLGALAIAGLLLHHALSAGRYAAHPATAGLWVGMTAVAAGSLVVVYVVEPLRQRARPWRVASVEQPAPGHWTLTLAPEGHRGLRFAAGQFVWLNVGHSAFSLRENPFSIASAPLQGPRLAFVIKEAGDFTGSLGKIAPGTRAYVDGPFGNLTVDGRTEPGVALIAGGVGIAPLLSILRQLRASDDVREVRLVYGSRTEEELLYRDELQAAGAVPVLSEPDADWKGERGLVDGPLLDRVLGPERFRDWLFVLCGPAAMLESVEAELLQRGTPRRRILSERFDYD